MVPVYEQETEGTTPLYYKTKDESGNEVLLPFYKMVYKTVEKKTAKILTIHSGASDSKITNYFKQAVGTVEYVDFANLSALPDFSSQTISTVTKAYVINPNDDEENPLYSQNNLFYRYGYIWTQVHPNNIIFDEATPSQILDSDGNLKTDLLGTYDMIIMEAGVKDQAISGDTFKKFNSLFILILNILQDNV